MLDLHLMFDTTHHQNNIVHVASAMQWRREEDISNLFYLVGHGISQEKKLIILTYYKGIDKSILSFDQTGKPLSSPHQHRISLRDSRMLRKF